MTTMTFEFSYDGLARCVRRAALGMALFVGVVVSVAHCGLGCMPANDPTQAERNYTTEIIACAATAGYPGAYDHESDMRCRAGVDCKYGLGPCK